MKKIIIAANVIGLLIAYGCKEKELPQKQAENHAHGNKHHMVSKPLSKVVKVEGIQVAFDLMSMEQHKMMMKMMNTKERHNHDSNHGLMLTILDQASMQPIKGAMVEVTMTENDGHTETKKAIIVEGQGMYHYAADFNIHAKNNCKISATINSNGKTYNTKTDFILEH